MPELRTRSELMVVGIAARTSNSAETGDPEAKIPALWSRYFANQVADGIPNRLPDPATFAVYTDYESDHTGEYSLVVGRQVSSLDEIPEGMVGVKIPAGRYLVFSVNGPVPGAVIAAWTSIWQYFEDQALYRRAYSSDFELYLNDGSGTIEIYIAIA